MKKFLQGGGNDSKVCDVPKFTRWVCDAHQDGLCGCKLKSGRRGDLEEEVVVCTGGGGGGWWWWWW
jgi:hypothetical protein